MPTDPAPSNGALQSVAARRVQDPSTFLLLAAALALAFIAGPREAILPASLAIIIALGLLAYGYVRDARLFALALAARNAAAMAISVAVNRGGAVFPDEADSVLMAGSLLDRWSGRLPAFDVPPLSKAGIGYLYAPFAAVGGRDVVAMRLASALAGSLAVVALWRFGRYMFGARAARRGALALAVFPSAVIWTATGLKEGFVLLALVLVAGCGLRVATDTSLSRAALWGLGLWPALFMLTSLREALAFVAAVAILLGALVSIAKAVRTRRDNAFAGLLRFSLAFGIIGTSLWISGYGVMGIDAIETLNPGYLNKVHDLGVVSGSAVGGDSSGGARVEATAEVPPASEAGTQLGKLAGRLPAGAIAVLARPWPTEAPTGALGEHAALARLLIIPDQLVWYGALFASVFGAIRALRRSGTRAFIPLAIVAATFFFYALTQANIGTAYRQRTALLPLVLLAAFVPAKVRSPSDADAVTFLLPTLGEGGTERHVLRVANALTTSERETSIAAFRGGDLRREADRLGVDVVDLDRRGRIDLGLPLRSARAIGRDRVWSTYLFAGNFWGGIGARLAGAPLMTNIRTSHPRSPAARLLEPLTAGEVVVANSHAVADAAMKRGFDPRCLRVVYNGVDAGDLAERAADSVGTREHWDLPEEAFVILVPGRIDPLKAQSVAIEAFGKADIRGSILCLAGPATLEVEKAYLATLKKLVSERGVKDEDPVAAIRFMGQVDEMAGLLSVSDVVMLTSEHEGMPTVLLEAMALGRPVIATRAGGTAEVVEDGVTGTLCDVGDASALASALEQLAGSRDVREAMGRKGRELIEGHFTDTCEVEGIGLALEASASIAAADDLPLAYDDGIRRGVRARGRGVSDAHDRDLK